MHSRVRNGTHLKAFILLCCLHIAAFRIEAKEGKGIPSSSIIGNNIGDNESERSFQLKSHRRRKYRTLIGRAPTIEVSAPVSVSNSFSSDRVLQKNKNKKIKKNKNKDKNKDKNDIKKGEAIVSITPTTMPTPIPTFTESSSPSVSISPSTEASNIPSISSKPTSFPTYFPSTFQSSSPSSNPILSPSSFPVMSPSSVPTMSPSSFPILSPSIFPTSSPSTRPLITMNPTSSPTFTIPVISNAPSSIDLIEDLGHSTDILTVLDESETPTVAPTLSQTTSLPTSVPTPSSTTSHPSSTLETTSPTTISSMEPTNQISLQPSIVQTSIQMSQILPLPNFMILLSTSSPVTDTSTLEQVTLTHMTTVFNESLPESLGFQSLQISLSEAMDLNRRRLRERNIYVFNGDAIFSSDDKIDPNLIHETILNAFSGENSENYELQLQSAQIDVLASFIQIKNENMVENEDSQINDEMTEIGEGIESDEAQNPNEIGTDTTTFKAMDSVYVVYGLTATILVTFLILTVAALQKHRSSMSYSYEHFMGSDTISSQGKSYSQMSEGTPMSSQKSSSPGRYVHLGPHYSKMSATSSSLSDNTRSHENPKKVSFSEDEDFGDSDNVYASDFELPLDADDLRQKNISKMRSTDADPRGTQTYIQFQPDQIDTRSYQINQQNPSYLPNRGNPIQFQHIQQFQNDLESHSVNNSPIPPQQSTGNNRPKSAWKSKITSVRRNSGQPWYTEQVSNDQEGVEKGEAAPEGTMFL